ncbi:DUF3408 domain-containing protein [Alistipes shahii]|uniref:DUF3408 domain-containing protein n=1 Tax=Alistipes shahii TaxID=328814 RepID=UPI00266C91D9|nr:DUF3408 domain-containing protein [Alistipes shahii]
MLNDYLSDLHFWETLGLIMFGSILLWSIFSGISSLIQHWRRPERPDAPAPLPADDREDFIRDRKREEPNKREMPLPAPFQSEQTDDCAMPAVQTENSDEWPSMEQPQTTEPVSGKKIVIPDFEQTYMTRHDIHVRSALYVSIDTKRKVLEVVKKIGSEYMTATSYVENIVRQHLELYKDDINRIYKQKGTKNLI